MSDGHFNRALLPPGGFQSGVTFGKATEKKLCVDALKLLLQKMDSKATTEEIDLQVKEFLKIHEELKDKK